jgi:hypothetical protein
MSKHSCSPGKRFNVRGKHSSVLQTSPRYRPGAIQTAAYACVRSCANAPRRHRSILPAGAAAYPSAIFALISDAFSASQASCLFVKHENNPLHKFVDGLVGAALNVLLNQLFNLGSVSLLQLKLDRGEDETVLLHSGFGSNARTVPATSPEYVGAFSFPYAFN